jgi:FKBP-type peptidyl-prolyl cis-trans isomerase FkpA
VPRFLLLISFSLFLLSCKDQGNISSFKYSDSGYHYKIYSLGEGNSPKPFDFASIHYKIREYKIGYGLQDSVFEDGTTLQLLPAQAFSKAILTLSQGDSASFILKGKGLPNGFIAPSDGEKFFQIDLILNEIYEKEIYLQKFKALKVWAKNAGPSETEIIENYLKSEGLRAEALPEGVYIIEIMKGNGPFITSGKVANIKYSGAFLDGAKFDASNGSFSYSVGEEGQVIKGIEIAIKRLKKGSQAKIIIPSHLAFGELGNSNGFIPPKAPVIYELEVIGVN